MAFLEGPGFICTWYTELVILVVDSVAQVSVELATFHYIVWKLIGILSYLGFQTLNPFTPIFHLGHLLLGFTFWGSLLNSPDVTYERLMSSSMSAPITLWLSEARRANPSTERGLYPEQ